MINLPETVDLPMKMDQDGNIRVSGTRVTLDTIIACYNRGDTPEGIHEGFETVPLADIYAVISYYLVHRDEVDAYIKANEEEGERIRAKLEALQTPKQKAHTEKLRRLLDEKRKEKEA